MSRSYAYPDITDGVEEHSDDQIKEKTLQNKKNRRCACEYHSKHFECLKLVPRSDHLRQKLVSLQCKYHKYNEHAASKGRNSIGLLCG